MSLLLSLFLSVAYSAVLKPTYLKMSSPQANYVFDVKPGKFQFTSGEMNIKKDIKACDQRAYESISEKIRGKLRQELFKGDKKIPDYFEITLDKKTFYVAPLSKSGIYLARLETEVNYLMTEAIYRCSKK